MSRFDRSDIMMELIELARERCLEVRQQLAYYHASVYKAEAAEVVERMIEQLKILADLIGHVEIKDAFLDYEARVQADFANPSLGESLLMSRASGLLQAIEQGLSEIVHHPSLLAGQNAKELARDIRRHRRQLLSFCRQGSPHWIFFSRL